jgi:hypothetical protein
MNKGTPIRLCAWAIVAFLSLNGLAPIVPPTKAYATGSSKESDDSTERLRESYYHVEGSDAAAEIVGRLGILLLEDDAEKLVGLDYKFSSGDRFRFQVAANREGWLSILHRSPTGIPEQLWPTPQGSTGGSTSDRLTANKPNLVPPPPAFFEFDDEVGEESFIVTILSGSSESASDGLPSDSTTGGVIVNFSLRGLDDFLKRGIIFNPGRDDSDHHVYFATPSGGADEDSAAVLEFQLKHRE